MESIVMMFLKLSNKQEELSRMKKHQQYINCKNSGSNPSGHPKKGAGLSTNLVSKYILNTRTISKTLSTYIWKLRTNYGT